MSKSSNGTILTVGLVGVGGYAAYKIIPALLKKLKGKRSTAQEGVGSAYGADYYAPDTSTTGESLPSQIANLIASLIGKGGGGASKGSNLQDPLAAASSSGANKLGYGNETISQALANGQGNPDDNNQDLMASIYDANNGDLADSGMNLSSQDLAAAEADTDSSIYTVGSTDISSNGLNASQNAMDDAFADSLAVSVPDDGGEDYEDDDEGDDD